MRSTGSPSPTRPAATASGWRAGCAPSAIEAYVIHPSSVPVSREHRRAKTDRLDTELLKRAFLGWLRGEPKHCSMAAIPTLEDEDARRPGRERQTLVEERTRILNRLKANLARLGIRGFRPNLARAPSQLEALRTPEGAAIPTNTLAEMRRDMDRLRFVKQQIKEIEKTRAKRLRKTPGERRHAMVRLLARVVGVGVETADMLVQEVFSREIRDRRALARYAGLTGAPDESGQRRRERGLAKAGNARVRRGMIELAWGHLLHQKGSPLSGVVSEANGGRPRRHAQDDDRRARSQAPHRAVAARDHRRGAGRSAASPGGVDARLSCCRSGVTVDARAADDGPRRRQPDIGLWPSRRGLEWARRLGASPPMRMTASWFDPHGRPNTSSRRATFAPDGELPSVSSPLSI